MKVFGWNFPRRNTKRQERVVETQSHDEPRKEASAVSNVRVILSGRRYTGLDATLASILADAGIVTVLAEPTAVKPPTVEWSARIHPMAHTPHIYRVSGPGGCEIALFTHVPHGCPEHVAREFVRLVEVQKAQEADRERVYRQTGR
jgi:hypothetical protein